MEATGHAATHVGRRASNEDFHCFEPDIGLFAVADGVGGYVGGEVASRLAVESLVEALSLQSPEGSKASLVERTRLAFRDANRRVAAASTGRLAGMCTTLAAVRIEGDMACIAHVGDSRVYRLRDGALERLTRDHSVVAEMEAAQGAAVSAAFASAYSHIVTQYIGAGASPVPDLRCVLLHPGDRFLLCTDGLSDALDDPRLAAMMDDPDPEMACERLVWGAFAAGGRDNITAILLDVA